MTTTEWKKLVSDFLDTTNLKVSLKAGRAISKRAKASHLPELYALLEKSDNFYVREMVCEPIARLDGAKALPLLFKTLQRGEQDGHDNDGLVNTVMGVLESDKSACLSYVLELLRSEGAGERIDAAWALGFLAPAFDPKILFDLYASDPDVEVQQTAGDSLQGFVDPKKKEATPEPEAFNGTWTWQDCEPKLKYSLEIKGATGICKISNSYAINIGDVALKIQMHVGNVFVGEHLFTNGAWYPVTAKRDGRHLHIQGAGQIWKLDKVDE